MATPSCKYCLGINLRPVCDYDGPGEPITIEWITSKIRQCIDCFCIAIPLMIRRDQIDCPICGEDIFDATGAPIMLAGDANIGSKIIRNCGQCHTSICYQCAYKLPANKCAICKGITRAGMSCNTAPMASMSPDLRGLMANLAIHMVAKRWKYHSMMREVIFEYMKWLSIAKTEPADPLSKFTPCDLVRTVWKAHMTITKNYSATCEIICGEFIHGRQDYGASEQRMKATEALVRRVEPFTTYTASEWKYAMQGPAFNLEPTGVIFVRHSIGRTATVRYHPGLTIEDVKILIGDPFAQSIYIFAGRQLRAGQTFESLGIYNEATIYQVINMRGD